MKIITIIGARPQFIKAAMISKAIINFNKQAGKNLIEELILHSGQHYDDNMSKIFFDELGIPKPQWILDGKNKNISELTTLISPILKSEKPNYVILYGDTNTTLAGALAAKENNINIIHIEAGLRSYNNAMPEEHNRIETDKISTILFCPTYTAIENLKKEGITNNVYKVGDVMYDSALFFEKISESKSTIIQDLCIQPKKYNLCTIHRAENTNNLNRLKYILSALNKIATKDKQLILPIHPRTKTIIKNNKDLSNIIFNNKYILLIEPVSFLDMIALESNAYKILTDSGGVQKEAYFHKVPCITLREETEWTETVTSGWNQIAGYKEEEIIKCYNCNPTTREINEYGKGTTAEKIIDIIWEKKY